MRDDITPGAGPAELGAGYHQLPVPRGAGQDPGPHGGAARPGQQRGGDRAHSAGKLCPQQRAQAGAGLHGESQPSLLAEAHKQQHNITLLQNISIPKYTTSTANLFLCAADIS